MRASAPTSWRPALCFAVATVAAQQAATAAPLTARGNEPGWQVEISDTTMAIRTLDAGTVTVTPAPPRRWRKASRPTGRR